MPRLSFDTNVPASQIPDDFLSSCTTLMSKTLGKNIAFCISTVNPGLKMILGDSYEPCGHIQISSIGGVGPDENKKCIEVLTNHIHQSLGISKHKLFMTFQSNIPDNIGFLGTTFHQLFVVEKGKRLH